MASAAATWRRLGATFVPFTAQTRMSGIDVEGSSIRKGAVESILAYAASPRPSLFSNRGGRRRGGGRAARRRRLRRA